MSWNNGKERKKFEKKQSTLVEQYRTSGMTEAQIHKICDFDLEVFRGERIYYTHTQALEFCTYDKDEVICDAPDFLLEYHTENIRDYSNRYWWIEELEKLYNAAMSLSNKEKEIITLYVFEGYTQKEIANIFQCSQVAIYKKISKIKKAFLPAIGGNADE